MPEPLRLISAESPEWAEWVGPVAHDFHHTAAHHLVWEEEEMGRAWLAVVGTRERFLAWPYLLRKIDAGTETMGEDLYDITSVDGYAGPLVFGCSPEDPFVASARESLFEHWRESRVVSVFTRFHPLLMNHLWVYNSPGCPCAGPASGCPCLVGMRHEGHTVSIDLRLSDAEAHAEYRDTHQRHIRRARRAGLTTEVDDSPRAFGEFVRLYHRTMLRNEALPHYLFSERFFESLRRALAPGASIHVARLEGKVVAAVFITEYGGIVQYLFGGVEEAAYSLSPLKLLLEDVRAWARSRGNHTLHLGGGRSCRDDDSLAFFKTGFSHRRHCFFTGRWVLDRTRYEGLVQVTRRALAASGAETPSGGPFPLYRALLSPCSPEAAVDREHTS